MKRFICIVMSIIILMTSFEVQAENLESKEKTIANDVLAVTKMMENMLQKTYKAEVERIKKEIIKKQYDYELTMESCNEQGNPFVDVDYVSLIAAYTTAKENAKEPVAIKDINFLNHTISENSIMEPVPLSCDKYVERENGKYEKKGKQYLLEDTEIDTYKKINDREYKKEGKERITLKKEKIVYGIVEFTVLSPEDLLKKYNLYTEEIKKIFAERKAVINAAISGRGLAQSVFVNLSTKNILSEEIMQYIDTLAESDISCNKKAILNTAISLVGNVPYEWGGKSKKAGYDDTWWTFEENGKQKGLDCSGYVEWVYRTAGYSESIWSKMHSTSEVLKNFTPISKDELEIGDLGLLNTGESINHVGIYLGDELWIHCASGESTVVINKFNFKVFRKINQIDEETLTPTEVVINRTNSETYSDEDVYLLAQTISHEAKGEGLNGWVGVGEVILNRINSTDFGDTLRDVIYQPGQFEYSEDIEKEMPDKKIVAVAKMILNGSLKIFNNPDVLYFRNPKGDYSSDWGPFKFYLSINHHAFYLGTAQFELKNEE